MHQRVIYATVLLHQFPHSSQGPYSLEIPALEPRPESARPHGGALGAASSGVLSWQRSSFELG